ncbi:helix-turn-helix domain-containing protein [Nocardioides sp. AE5]|uniref:helix-turn-helix transcriptional regulator n=1 Tax=Nocardioides sp. AE5 TaxID=2962573 RepID=UPI002880E30A|nr:FaeA/PapI family transcriptional regulator [Nocardioides sp. AE5]MDT0203452.1 FaeA/PapI family transcriptional regulator [Nocardioides sp. AE5]
MAADIGNERGRRGEVITHLRSLDLPATITEVADALGIHANTARFHLERLVASGQAQRSIAEDHGPGRPPLLFSATPGMDPTGPRQYRLLAEILARALVAEQASVAPERRALDAGRGWARERMAELEDEAKPADKDPVVRLAGLLDRLGFAPDVRRKRGRSLPVIGLRHCPFLELAGNRSEVVCAVHWGLMSGALESWRAPLDVVGLEPFVEPDLCLTHLGTVD